jgi:hypothetical protein
MSEEAKSLLTLIALIFASAGLVVAILCWFIAREMQD